MPGIPLAWYDAHARRKDSAGGFVWDTDDGIGTFIPGVIEGKGTVKGLRGGGGAYVADGAHKDATWEYGGG